MYRVAWLSVFLAIGLWNSPSLHAQRAPEAFVSDIESGQGYRFIISVPVRHGRALGIDDAGELTLHPPAEADSQVWRLTKVAKGVYRIHNDARGPRSSLSGQVDNRPNLMPTSNSPNQLWQLIPSPSDPSQMVLVNLGSGTAKCLTWVTGNAFAMKQQDWSRNQLWRVSKVNRDLPETFNDYQSREREIRPGPPATDVVIELTNTHSKELWVLLYDRAQPNGTMQVKIPPGQSAKVTLERETEGSLLEVYERLDPFGGFRREEFVTPMPLATRYDLSVYELIVQSISIDSTVPGGKLDDVQYSPKSVGWFELPTGMHLKSGPLDVYQVAKAQQNPGVVRRIDMSQLRSKSTPADPVEELLQKYQNK